VTLHVTLRGDFKNLHRVQQCHSY